jgi:hypothetical protein
LATAYSAAAFTLVPKSTSGFSLAFGSGPSDFPYIQMSAAGTVASDMSLQPYGGNVGIGIASPARQVHLHNSSGDNNLHITNSTTGATATDGFSIVSQSSTNDVLLNQRETANMRFFTGNTERMRIDSSGHLIVPNGITLGTAVGTYNAANTLEDYEEGTWTPDVNFGGGTTGITYTNVDGAYVKVGRLVTFMGQITFSNKGTSTGVANVSGLPFSVNGGMIGTTNEGGAFMYVSANVATSGSWCLNCLESTTTANVTIDGSNAVETDFNNSTALRFTGHYYTNS